MLRKLRGISRRNKGFTLVELLVVVAILGILAAVAVPNLMGVLGTARTNAALTELSTIQTSMDAMMADNQLTLVTATSATDDMGAFPTGNVLYPNYMRSQFTKGTYSCIANGKVTQESTGY